MVDIKRKCAGCGQVKNRDELIKLTRRNSDSEVIINPDSKTFGRSVYLCYNNACIKKSFYKNKLEKLLRTKIKEETKGILIDFKQY